MQQQRLVPPGEKMALDASATLAASFLPHGGGAYREQGGVFRRCVVLFFPPFLSSLCSHIIRWSERGKTGYGIQFNQKGTRWEETTT